jgi:hypothetical protein
MQISPTALNIVVDAVRVLSAMSLGVFAGGMLTEACVLVPYWQSLRPAEFLAWYAGHGHRLQSFFGPLTYVTGLLALAAAILTLWAGHSSRWLTMLAAIITAIVVATFFLYFGKANASFANATLGVEEVAAELTRWATWHWWRTGLSFVALTAAMMAWWRHK